MQVRGSGLGQSLSWRVGALFGVLVALLAVGLGPLAVAASAEEESEEELETPAAVTFPGGPLTVSIGPLGQCESSYAGVGNNYYPGFGTLGDCGLFLAFPTVSADKAATGQPAALEGTTWGFEGAAGPRIPNDGEGGEEYTAVGSQSPITGAGTSASPYLETTVFAVKQKEPPEMEFARITETTEYVNGEAQFTSTYDVKNMLTKGHKIYFRAIYAGDLYVSGEDFGTGVFSGGPPRFIGGLSLGVIGGFVEVPAPALPWSSFQEGCWNETGGPAMESEGRCSGAVPTDQGIWHDVRSTVEEPHAFNETIEPNNVDNAAGVEWDQLRETGLEGGSEQAFTIVNRTSVPSGLKVSPVSQTLTQGQTETILVTAADLAGVPYAGKSVDYSVSGANPQSGSVTLGSSGQAQISYVGHNAGIDTIQMFVDLAGSGKEAAGDPSATATVTFLPAKPPPPKGPPPPPAPNSTYKIQSVHANSNGTITITFVPTQEGTATLEVTVPTATIARNEALAARSKKCKRGQIRLKGKCRPATTVSGKISATGKAGVPLKLTVSASGKVKAALRKGKTVYLTAKLTYRSKLGGKPTVEVFHLKAKGSRPHHHGHH
jgi:hypothetical protein